MNIGTTIQENIAKKRLRDRQLIDGELFEVGVFTRDGKTLIKTEYRADVSLLLLEGYGVIHGEVLERILY